VIPSRAHACWFALAGSVALLTSGCVVGPNFTKPAAPAAGGYSPNALSAPAATPDVAGGEAQRFVEGADIPGLWWTVFHSPPLNALLERSLANSPDIAAAQAALTVARETVLAQRGAFYPSVTAQFSAARSKTSGEISPTPNSGDLYFGLYTPQVGVSYVPDVFGLNRRAVESLQAQAEQRRFALAATHLALSGNVIAAAIQEASLREQIGATRALVDINTNMLAVLRNQLANGYASRLDVAAQESQLAQVLSTLPPLQKALSQQRHLLTALSGALPNDELPETFELSGLELPRDLPVSLPSQLVEQRPDIRQAEENLHAASANIGVAVASRLPSFTITADVGSTALRAGEIFAAGTAFGDLAGAVAQPIFQGRRLLHQERAARAAYVQAEALFRSTVITAFQNVADTLAALQQDADALNAAAQATDAARVTLDITRQQLEAGAIGTLVLLNAEQVYSQATINLVQARANRFADTAALFQALGGGWWNRPANVSARNR
jgi:NodT family efflux transporter outer membrane factor (OMF) lipoprotein